MENALLAKLEIPENVLNQIKDELYRLLKNEIEEERERNEIMSVKDLASLLQVSLSTANNITNRYDDFPTIRIGNKKRMIKGDVINWLREHEYISPSNFQGLEGR